MTLCYARIRVRLEFGLELGLYLDEWPKNTEPDEWKYINEVSIENEKSDF